MGIEKVLCGITGEDKEMTTATTESNCPLVRNMGYYEGHGICLNCPLEKCLEENHHKLTYSERGKLGGYVTFFRYGREGMSDRGKKGGRSRLPTLAVIRQQQLLRAQYKKEGLDIPGELLNNLKELRKLLRQRSNGKNKEGARGDLIASGSGGVVIEQTNYKP